MFAPTCKLVLSAIPKGSRENNKISLNGVAQMEPT